MIARVHCTIVLLIFRWPPRLSLLWLSFPYFRFSLPFTLRVLKETPTMQHDFFMLLCSIVDQTPLNSCFSFRVTMVEHIVSVLNEYEERLRRCPHVPRFSYGRPMLRDEGGPNRYFLNYLFCDQSVVIAFLKDIGLLQSTMLCNTCGRDMTWSAASNIPEGFRWRCHRTVAGVRCNECASIKQGSWFQQGNLTLQEIMIITYDTVCREPATKIQSEYRLSSHTVADWGMFCRETMLVFLEGCSVKLDGPNTTVEIDESNFGRPKYHGGHPVKGQWVFGGVQRGSGKTFLVPVPDRIQIRSNTSVMNNFEVRFYCN